METKAMDKLFVLIALFLLASCGNADIKYQDVEGQAWKTENQLRFTVSAEEMNTGTPSIYIRHTDDYPFQNLWLKVSCEPKDSALNFSRYEFQLAQPTGQWLGKKRGAVYSLVSPLENLACSDTCELVIEQNMRANPLVGVQSVGIGF